MIGDGVKDRKFPLFTAISYLVLIALTFAIYDFLRKQGEALTRISSGISFTPPSVLHANPVLDALIALVAVIFVGKLLGYLLKKVGQPSVIGEIVAGLLLGPSLLGHFWPAVAHRLVPETSLPALNIIAQIGIILYMFQVGLDLNRQQFKGRAASIALISHASIAIPFLLGAALSLWLYPLYATSGVSFTVYSLFIGVAVSITAFPVLARILGDTGLSKTALGGMALSCAAIDDVTAWCLLAFVICVVQSEASSIYMNLGLAAAFLGAMIFFVQPALRKLSERKVTQNVMVLIILMVLMASIASEWVGLHPIFGAFLLGVLIPHDSSLAQSFSNQIKNIVRILLLPAFFVVTGLRTDLGLLAGFDQWLACSLIILVSVAGKFGGAVLVSRYAGGFSIRESLAMGALMNTRGLVELIVLNIGLSLGVISPTIFSMMVIMAIVTTLMTMPLLKIFLPNELRNQK